ncbi:protein ANKUB1-like [Liolophura sinensis]|uniref:protein ANKUB1-like n=1 Tax=Liolophura sinensis TaxID=3198878 RepID=UPI0031587C2D
MRIFGLFEGERVPLELPEGVPVSEIKERIWKLLNIPEESGNQDKKVIVLTYGGSDLEDSWIFSDLGIRPGVTVKVSLQEEVKPVLFIFCVFDRRTINMYHNMQVGHMTVAELKTFAAKKTGIPVGVFRLVTRDGREMFDAFTLEKYSVDVGHTVHMETWDGWNDFLKLSVMGYTSNVMAHLFSDEAVARYQMKVALFIAAHFGHVDLAVTLLRNGIRPNDPVGDHPARQWCSEDSHIDSMKTPVHEATENGHLGVIRAFVNHDIRCVLVKDGRGLTPISVALRNKFKNIVQFLVTKQWTKFPVGKNQSIPLTIFFSTINWCERAKERVFLMRGPGKSSLKRRPPRGALVSNGVIVDGFSPSQMNAKPKALPREDGKRRNFEVWQMGGDDPELYFRRIQMFDKTLGALKTKRASKWGKMMDKAMLNINPFSVSLDGLSESPVTPSSDNSRLDTLDAGRFKLPPIQARKSLSHQNLGSARASDVFSLAESQSPEPNLRSSPLKNLTKQLPKPKKKALKSALSISVPNIKVDNDSFPTVSKTFLGSRSTFVSAQADGDESKSGVGGSTAEATKMNRGKRRRKIASSMLLSDSNTTNSALPLPVVQYDDTAHPKFYYNSTEGNIVTSTLDLYEKYRGMNSRDYAIHCMTIANSFKEKPWLERVRIALNLTSKTVKKRYWDSSHNNTTLKTHKSTGALTTRS